MAPNRQPTPSARERLLEAASDLFYAHGINATGIDAIVERAGVALATLYNQFGGKSQLVAAYLEERDHRWRADWDEVLAATAGPRERVLSLFDALERWRVPDGQYRGCAFVAATVEITDAGHPAVAVISRHKMGCRQRLAKLARDAGAVDPDAVAADILVIYEGTITSMMLEASSEPIRRARRMTAALLPPHGTC